MGALRPWGSEQPLNPSVTPTPAAPAAQPWGEPQGQLPGGPGPVQPTVGTTAVSGGTTVLPPDMIGDIPPPPVPAPPVTGPGVAGLHGTEAGTFSRPGSGAVRPFRTAAYTPKPQQRFGPGVATVGGDTGVQGLGLDPEQAAEILRNRAAGRAF